MIANGSTTTIIPDGLISAQKDRKVILFVGAGVSVNLGLPSFRELVSHIGEEMGFDPDIFHSLGSYGALAEYYQLERGAIGELRSWMDTTWHPQNVDISASQIHNALVELDFPIIYTTNYDRWIESAYGSKGKPFTRIVSVSDLTKARRGETEIVKFHGDFSDDDSLVLTESSYFNRMNFEAPLDIKLRSDSLGSPVLFIGYSLGDPNIRYLLYKLQQLWRDSPRPNPRPTSYIFLSRPNIVEEKLLADRGIHPIVWKNDHPGEALKEFSETLLEVTKSGA